MIDLCHHNTNFNSLEIYTFSTTVDDTYMVYSLDTQLLDS